MSEVTKTTEFLSKAGFEKLAKEVNKKQKHLSSMPENPKDGEVVLYSGESTSEFKKGHCYKAEVSLIDDTTSVSWIDISLDAADEISYENSIEETSVTNLKEAIDKLVLLEKEIRSTLQSIQKLIPSAADESNKLVANSQINYSAGNSSTPIYFEDGQIKSCSHTLNADVPNDAKFTDTTAGTTYASTNVPDSQVFATNGTVKNVHDALGQMINTTNSNLSSLDQQVQSFIASPKIPTTAQSGEGAIWIE